MEQANIETYTVKENTYIQAGENKIKKNKNEK
jgi:hypothetical protein